LEASLKMVGRGSVRTGRRVSRAPRVIPISLILLALVGSYIPCLRDAADNR
jgi:hypothetical protein